MHLGHFLHLPFDNVMADDVQDSSSRFEFRNESMDELALVYSEVRICMEKGQATQKSITLKGIGELFFNQGTRVWQESFFCSDKRKKLVKKTGTPVEWFE